MPINVFQVGAFGHSRRQNFDAFVSNRQRFQKMWPTMAPCQPPSFWCQPALSPKPSRGVVPNVYSSHGSRQVAVVILPDKRQRILRLDDTLCRHLIMGQKSGNFMRKEPRVPSKRPLSCLRYSYVRDLSLLITVSSKSQLPSFPLRSSHGSLACIGDRREKWEVRWVAARRTTPPAGSSC